MLFLLLLHPVAQPPFQALSYCSSFLPQTHSSTLPLPSSQGRRAAGPQGRRAAFWASLLRRCHCLSWNASSPPLARGGVAGGSPLSYKAALNALSLPSMADILESREQPGMSNTKPVSLEAAVVLVLAAAVVMGIIVMFWACATCQTLSHVFLTCIIPNPPNYPTSQMVSSPVYR